MEPFEREYQDQCSDFDDRPEWDDLSSFEETDENDGRMDEEDFYRHLEEY
ncbi:MAG: hypothetical protein RLN88_13440 [Ekhidna sp.]